MRSQYILTKACFLILVSICSACSTVPKKTATCESLGTSKTKQVVDIYKIEDALAKNLRLQAHGIESQEKDIEHSRTFKTWVRTRANR